MMQTGVLLKNYNNYKIGGPASYFLEVNSKEQLIQELRGWKEKKPIFILGKGTNILISEKGFEGLIVHNNILGIEKNGEEITVGAGVLMSDLLNFCINSSLSGLEWAGGLPGSVGGAVRGNAGAFKGEIKDTVLKVESINLNIFKTTLKTNKECEFGYRTSIFKTKATDELITFVTFKLSSGDKSQIEKNIKEKIDYRNLRHPMDKPSLGSTFKNVPLDSLSLEVKESLMEFVKNDPFPVIPVAKLLYLCNLKGKREGDAQISEKHPNFIINLGNAKSDDVINLIKYAKSAVRKKFNVILEEEIMYLSS